MVEGKKARDGVTRNQQCLSKHLFNHENIMSIYRPLAKTGHKIKPKDIGKRIACSLKGRIKGARKIRYKEQ